MAGRRCPTKGCPTILTRGQRYCPTHLREYEARRGTPTQRGYGADHRALRARWQARIDAGELVHCVTCGATLTRQAWDLGHDEAKSRWIGPQCVPCNRSEGGRRGAAASR